MTDRYRDPVELCHLIGRQENANLGRGLRGRGSSGIIHHRPIGTRIRFSGYPPVPNCLTAISCPLSSQPRFSCSYARGAQPLCYAITRSTRLASHVSIYLFITICGGRNRTGAIAQAERRLLFASRPQRREETRQMEKITCVANTGTCAIAVDKI